MSAIDTFGVIIDTLRTSSGTNVSIVDPAPETILISDIAHALSRITRFGGHVVAEHYSVAEHCIACVDLGLKLELGQDALRAILLHDAAEAYLGDVIRPLKINLPLYYEYEAKFETVIASKFNVDFAAHAEQIKLVDNILLVHEKRKLLQNSSTFVFIDEDKYKLPDNCDWEFCLMQLQPNEAKSMYLAVAHDVGIETCQ